MAQTKQLFDEMESLFTLCKRHLNSLSLAVKTTPTSSRILTSKMNVLDETLNTLSNAHTAWKSKANLSTDDLSAHAYSNKWLEDRWTEADTVLDQANVLHCFNTSRSWCFWRNK